MDVVMQRGGADLSSVGVSGRCRRTSRSNVMKLSRKSGLQQKYEKNKHVPVNNTLLIVQAALFIIV